MAYTSGNANNIQELFTVIENMLTSNGWTEHSLTKNSSNVNNGSIFVGSGGGNDKIYIYLSINELEDRMVLDSSVAWDASLGSFEQPGSIQQWLQATGQEVKDIPIFTISNNERFYYWVFVDNYRLIVVARMSIVYESMYIGFLNPISSERQYPYPMYVCGNGHVSGSSWPQNANGSFVFPENKCGWLRRADGTWRYFTATVPDPDPRADGTIFPYNSHNKKLIPNYKEVDSINQDNFLLIPIMLQTNNPTDINGLLRGCYWISGTRDIDTERILVYNSEQYIVFDTKEYRGTNTYFAIKLA